MSVSSFGVAESNWYRTNSLRVREFEKVSDFDDLRRESDNESTMGRMSKKKKNIKKKINRGRN